MQGPRESRPFVSCVMPTRDRRQFAAQAIWYFLRQDFPSRELIVVDDGSESAADLVPPDPRVRYLRLASRTPLGAKLNLGCELARGEYIANWEDDDWIGQHRLRAQVEKLRACASRACLAHPAHYHLITGQVWRWSDHGQPQPPSRCGPALYARSAWASAPFPELDRWPGQPFPPSITRPRFQAMRLTTTTSSSSTLTTPARTATRTGRGLPARWKRLPRVCRATWTSTPGCATDRLSGGSRRLRGSRSLRGPSSTTATAAWRSTSRSGSHAWASRWTSCRSRSTEPAIRRSSSRSSTTPSR